MPELTIYRKSDTTLPMVCMYCGATAATRREWRVVNRTPCAASGGGSDLGAVPSGDDPISAVIGLVLLPLALWDLLKGSVAVIHSVTRRATPARPEPARPAQTPPSTLVAVTACGRHDRFGGRFVLAGAGAFIAVAALWVWTIQVTRRAMGTDDTGPAVALVLAAIGSTVLLPIALSVWYVFRGPVIVDRVTEETVVLDRVRQAYFDATGVHPNGQSEGGVRPPRRR